MAGSHVTAVDLLRALRDQIERKISASEDFRALMALDAQIALLQADRADVVRGAAAPPVPDRRRHPRLVLMDCS